VLANHGLVQQKPKMIADSGSAMIIPQQATEPFPAFNLPGHGSDFRPRIDQFILQALMVSPCATGSASVPFGLRTRFTQRQAGLFQKSLACAAWHPILLPIASYAISLRQSPVSASVAG